MREKVRFGGGGGVEKDCCKYKRVGQRKRDT